MATATSTLQQREGELVVSFYLTLYKPDTRGDEVNRIKELMSLNLDCMTSSRILGYRGINVY